MMLPREMRVIAAMLEQLNADDAECPNTCFAGGQLEVYFADIHTGTIRLSDDKDITSWAFYPLHKKDAKATP